MKPPFSVIIGKIHLDRNRYNIRQTLWKTLKNVTEGHKSRAEYMDISINVLGKKD